MFLLLDGWIQNVLNLIYILSYIQRSPSISVVISHPYTYNGIYPFFHLHFKLTSCNVIALNSNQKKKEREIIIQREKRHIQINFYKDVNFNVQGRGDNNDT